MLSFEDIKELLEASGADAYELMLQETRGSEFYFIGHRLDMNRAKDIADYTATVYKMSGEGKRGKASGTIAPTLSKEEAAEKIARLLDAAGLIKNNFYELHAPSEEADGNAENESVPAAGESALTAEEEAAAFIKVMRGAAEDEARRVNSYEVFVNDISRRFVNSLGVSFSDSGRKCMLEAVVNAKKDGHEVEICREFASGGCDSDGLLAEINGMLDTGCDRLKAVPTPADANGLPVVFVTEAAAEIYKYFIYKTDARFKYMGYSDAEIGKKLVELDGGDALTVETLPFLPHSSENASFDAEGGRVRQLTLVEDNEVRAFAGARQFAEYLGIGESFEPGNFKVTGGSAEAEELLKGPCLVAAEFSDFQVDPIAGDIAGEIRLAYLKGADGSVVCVTGGSITGNMAQAAKTLKASKELRQYDSLLVPKATRLFGLSVAGADAE